MSGETLVLTLHSFDKGGRSYVTARVSGVGEDGTYGTRVSATATLGTARLPADPEELLAFFLERAAFLVYHR